jgi:hypothetical protein
MGSMEETHGDESIEGNVQAMESNEGKRLKDG